MYKCFSASAHLLKCTHVIIIVFKVCNYHHEFYRPENLCLLITGQVKPEDVFERIKSFEEKILSKVSHCKVFTFTTPVSTISFIIIYTG